MLAEPHAAHHWVIIFLWCISMMEAQPLSAIIALFDIFMHDDIFFISIDDIFIMPGCILIMFVQRLFFIIAVFDMRLHDIIMFMSAADIFMLDIEEWSIVFVGWATPEVPIATARARKAKMDLAGFMMHLKVRLIVLSKRTPNPFDPEMTPFKLT